MEIGTSVHAKDLVLPDGTTLSTDPEALVLHVVEPAAEAAAEAGEAAEQAQGAEEVPAPVEAAAEE
jgi:large subunit ribosomal protein L25